MNLSFSNLRQALSLRNQIDQLEARLAGVLSGSSAATKGRSGGRLSAEGRAKIAAAARKRWAAKRAQASDTNKPSTSKSKTRPGGISAAGRKRLSELMRARWAARKKAAGKSKAR